MNRPIGLLGNVTPSFIRLWALNAARGRRGRRPDQPINLVNVLRTKLSARMGNGIYEGARIFCV